MMSNRSIILYDSTYLPFRTDLFYCTPYACISMFEYLVIFYLPRIFGPCDFCTYQGSNILSSSNRWIYCLNNPSDVINRPIDIDTSISTLVNYILSYPLYLTLLIFIILAVCLHCNVDPFISITPLPCGTICVTKTLGDKTKITTNIVMISIA
jgi:hypothetical protein